MFRKTDNSPVVFVEQFFESLADVQIWSDEGVVEILVPPRVVMRWAEIERALKSEPESDR